MCIHYTMAKAKNSPGQCRGHVVSQGVPLSVVPVSGDIQICDGALTTIRTKSLRICLGIVLCLGIVPVSV